MKSRIAVYLSELDRLTRKPAMSRSERSRADFLMVQISVLRSEGVNRSSAAGAGALSQELSPEMRAWSLKLRGLEIPPELRDMVEGVQGLDSWSAGSQGGYIVPQEFQRETFDAIAQVDPLFSIENVGLLLESVGGAPDPVVPGRNNPGPADPPPGGRLRPRKVSGFDLTTIASAQVGEGSVAGNPTISLGGAVLNGYQHKISLPVSLELEQDSFAQVVDLLRRAYSAAFARGMGAQLVNGTGSGQPQGVLTGAADSGYTTAAAGAISLDDLEAIYFSVNRAYRGISARWAMNDATYLLARKALTAAGYPIFGSASEDREMIFGKPVLICPSMPSAAGSKGILFGDFSRFLVRLGPLVIQRTLDMIEYGQALYNGRMRVDSLVFDPSSSGTPPIKFATLHA